MQIIKAMKCLIIIAMFLGGCATSYDRVYIEINETTMEQMMNIYNPVIEKGFCLNPTKGIENVMSGGPAWSEMPLCSKSAIVMHTHPIYGEPWASVLDEMGWDEYSRLYGNKTFGILGIGYVKFYEKSGWVQSGMR
jgi:hypothetical protein